MLIYLIQTQMLLDEHNRELEV